MTLKSTQNGHTDVYMEIRGSGSVNNEQHRCEIAPDRRPGLCTEGPGVPLLGHPCFWVEVIAILYTETEPITQALAFVLPKKTY